MTDASRARVSVARMGNTYRLGSHPSEETRAKISVTCTGRVVSSETQAKLAAAGMGHAPTGPKHHTAETLAKMSIAMTGPLNFHWKGGLRLAWARNRAKRRALGFHPLNSPFPGCDAHHINNDDVIHMPHELHNSIYHNQYTGQGMAQMNALAGQYLTEDWT